MNPNELDLFSALVTIFTATIGLVFLAADQPARATFATVLGGGLIATSIELVAIYKYWYAVHPRHLDAVARHLDGDIDLHPSADVGVAEPAANVQVLADIELADVTVDESVFLPEAAIHDG